MIFFIIFNMEQVLKLINEMEYVKNKESHLWNESYDNILDQLNDIKDKSTMDESYALQQFKLLDISSCESFNDYIHIHDYVKTTKKIKKRENLKCPNCSGYNIDYVDGVYICSCCKIVISKHENNSNISKQQTDIGKHILKQLNIITGKNITPPPFVYTFLPYVQLWISDRKYLYDFLLYTNEYKNFIRKMKQIDSTKIVDENYFKEKIELNNHNIISYLEFKLYIHYFHQLLEKMKIYNYYINDINRNIDKIYDVVNKFKDNYIENDHKFDEALNNDKDYILFKHIICYYQSNYLTEYNEIKDNVEKILNYKLHYPGLMFEFRLLNLTNGKIPHRYNYQQNYIHFIKLMYNVKLQEMSEYDKNEIVSLMVDFNSFAKKYKQSITGKQHNSCLWQIVLLCVLNLPYFTNYDYITYILPKRNDTALIKIKEIWELYNIINYRKMAKYKNKREIEENIEESILQIEDDEINKNKIMDFINKDGEYYNRELEEEYIKEKYHINYKNNNINTSHSDDEETDNNSENYDDFDNYSEDNYNNSEDFSDEDFSYNNDSSEDEYTCYD